MFSFLSFCMLGWCVVQAELDIVFEDAECAYVNDIFIDPDNCKLEVTDNSEYETALATEIVIIKQLPATFMLRANINGIEKGEYTNDMGINIETKVCEIKDEKNSLTTILLQAINIDPDDCPPEPGTYGNDAFVLSRNEGLPDSFPVGKYLLNVTLLNDDTTFVIVHIYLTVV